MKLMVNGSQTHVATGGKEFDASLPCVVFIHGSGLDHRSWVLQTRWFAYNGYSVLAPDLPGHSLSEGEALASIEQSGEWLAELLKAASVESAHLVSHSQGFLTALELAHKSPELVKSICGIGTAAAIPVNQMLIDTALNANEKAAKMMTQWGFGQQMHLGVSPTPGMQPIGIGQHIMASNPLAIDLQACADYQNGDVAAESLNIPSLMILAGQDKMTPLKAGKLVAEKLNAQVHVLNDYGHMLPIEAPKQVLHLLRDFIQKVEEH